MHVTTERPSVGIVGREEELALLRERFGSDAAQKALMLTGGPGIGKTTLWEAGVDAARRHGARVLSARASGADTKLSFAALIDLLDGIATEELTDLPPPQLNALEVALLRAEPTAAPPQEGAIAVAFLNALRALAARDPVVVAVDDVQWLDPPSEDALAFAARRLDSATIGFLLARRPGSPTELERTLERGGLEHLDLGSLSLGATRRLLSERLGLSLPRHVLGRIFDSTSGNPLFALEVGRMLTRRGPPLIGEDIPVPDAVEELLGTRVAGLPGPVRRLLLAVALSADLRASELAAIASPAVLDDAVDAGILVVDGNRVRASHPLLAAAAKGRSRARDRRRLHLKLAGVVADEELRAYHLAHATENPDPELAATVAAAAGSASARGAAREAAELAEHALRLTPPGSRERNGRLLALGRYLEVAGEQRRLTDLLAPELDSLPAGAARVEACLRLAGGVVSGNDDIRRYFERALAESGSDAQLRAPVLAAMAENTASVRVERIREAEAWALEALSPARRAGPELERAALYALGWARSLGGRPIDDVCERFLAVSDSAFYIAESPERVAAQRLVWRGDVSRARSALSRLLAMADDRGEPSSYAFQRLHLCELELRIGDWDAASRLLEEWAESAERGLLPWPMYERCRALLAAGRGLPDQAERWAAEAIERAKATGVRWDFLEATRAVGIARLLGHEPVESAAGLRAVWEHTRREGVDEPGVFPVAPELVEALVELGELDEAQAVTDRLLELSERQEHAWGRATAKRCAAQVRLAASTYDEDAAADLAGAAAAYGNLGLRFDTARTLRALGRAQRRLKKWGGARSSLEQAVAAFDELGSVGWAEDTRAELGRVGARRPKAAGELTPAERRVAELAAEGLANKEIARALFVTVNTVERNLSRAYAKLGVRSRAQLVQRLNPDAQRP